MTCADPEWGQDDLAMVTGVSIKMAHIFQCINMCRVLKKLKNHKNIGFLSNSGPDLLKNHKATEPAFNVGSSSARQRNAI